MTKNLCIYFVSRVSVPLFHSNWLRSTSSILIHIKVMPGYFLPFELSYFLHKHQMKATKNAQAYTVGTHGCV